MLAVATAPVQKKTAAPSGAAVESTERRVRLLADQVRVEDVVAARRTGAVDHLEAEQVASAQRDAVRVRAERRRQRDVAPEARVRQVGDGGALAEGECHRDARVAEAG